MTGFEPRTSGIGSDHSTNWATTTAQNAVILSTESCGVMNNIEILMHDFCHLPRFHQWWYLLQLMQVVSYKKKVFTEWVNYL